MPTSEFESALSERIEFAVFVAYEQWVREAVYGSYNPYDVLGRLLPGLNDALGAAVAARGGWGALEPVSGVAADAGKHLISEMAAQVVTAQVAALAPHVPGATLLTQVITDAVGRAVSVFVDDPESWRLAMHVGDRAPVAALTDAIRGAVPAGPDDAGGDSLPAAPMPADEGGDYGAPRVLHAIESTARVQSDLLAIRELWFLKADASGFDLDYATLASVLVKLSSGTSSIDLLATPTPNESASQGGAVTGSAGTAHTGTADQAAGDELSAYGGLKQSYIDRLDALPDKVSAVIHVWIELLNKASFYHVESDGSIDRLSGAEAAQVVDTLIMVLIGRAELHLSLPTLPPGYDPTPATETAAATEAPATAETHPAAVAEAPASSEHHDTAAATDAPAASGLGSGGSFNFGAGATADSHADAAVASDAGPAADPADTHLAAGADVQTPALIVTPPADQAPQHDQAPASTDPTHPHADYLFS